MHAELLMPLGYGTGQFAKSHIGNASREQIGDLPQRRQEPGLGSPWKRCFHVDG